MTRQRIAAILLSADLLAAAPALAEEAPTAPATPATPAAPAPAPTTGRLYVSYPQQAHGDFPGHIAIDDAWLADTVAPGACVYLELPPGSHSMHALVNTDVKFDLAAGGSAYVELRVRHVYIAGTPDDSLVPKTADALADTSKCQAMAAP